MQTVDVAPPAAEGTACLARMRRDRTPVGLDKESLPQGQVVHAGALGSSQALVATPERRRRPAHCRRQRPHHKDGYDTTAKWGDHGCHKEHDEHDGEGRCKVQMARGGSE
jgi:hypothetical protein